jgi:hypothetical protein
VYGDLKESPSTYAVTGFADPEKINPGERGFSLGESELAISRPALTRCSMAACCWPSRKAKPR